jgi:hypothetical protein
LVSGLTHAPLQTTSPPGQPHVPPWQMAPSALQFCPALVPVHEPLAPQCVWLLLGSTQAPPHSTSGATHEVVQPFEQTSVPGQDWPQPPHEFVAVMKSRHVDGLPPATHAV